MQLLSHRVFNTVLAGDLLIGLYSKFPLMSSIMAGGMVLFSSFPDKVEQLGLKHRGLSHSVLIYFSLGVFYYWASTIFNQYLDLISYIGYGFVCGCLGHIFADTFSKKGIKILGAKFNFNLYSTGKISEQVFLFGFILLNCLLMYWFVIAK
jgi:membrane-bound metal-dependent hydrolase YbcI (DUF457 family)